MKSSLRQLPLPLNATVCLISARRFGDAIINASIAKAAAQSRPDIRWIIWTKPEFAPLFELMGFNNIVISEFPIAGGAKKFAKDCGLSILKAIYQLRRLKLDASIDFIGDAREAALGILIAANSHYSPRWDSSHWMHKLIWKANIPIVKYVDISSNQVQVYEIITNLLRKVTGTHFEVEHQVRPVPQNPAIAFHPFPSAQFRYWPIQNWQKLRQLLIEKNLTPNVICSSSEKQLADLYFKNEHGVEIKSCATIQELILELQKFDILVGVDSFLIHLANTLGIKTISITAGHLPHWWSPQGNIPLGQSGGCIDYPCANQPSCLGKANESQCIKSIKPEQVIDAIELVTP